MNRLEDEFAFKSLSRTPKCLAGLSIMLVDDSRAVSEVIRMMAIRSGARLRRADCLASAQRHMNLFRPDIVITDLSLPDGSGVEVAKLVAEKMDPAPSILMLSASEEAVTEGAAKEAGADGYLLKPIEGLGAFQAAVLAVLPGKGAGAPEWEADFKTDLSESDVLVQDLGNVLDLFEEALRDPDEGALKFGAQFLLGVATTAGDVELAEGARVLSARLAEGHPGLAATHAAVDMLRARLGGPMAEAG